MASRMILMFCLMLMKVASITAQSLYDSAVIDLRNVSLKDCQVPLEKPWEFYPGSLITSQQLALAAENVRLPHFWTTKNAAFEVASYRTKLILPQKLVGQSLSLWMPDVYCSYNLWIDGVHHASNGVVSAEKYKAMPQWLPRQVVFTPRSNSVDIILNVSGHFHDRRGVGKHIYLAETAWLANHLANTQRMETTLFISLIILALAFAVLFFQSRTKPFLFFSLLCLSWAFRSAFSNDYLIAQWFNDINWNAVIRVEYISLYLTTLFALLFIASNFPQDVNKTFMRFYIFFTVLFTVFTLFAAPLVFTRFVQLYLAFSSLLLVTSLITLVKALIHERSHVRYFIASYLTGIGLFGYVILAYEQVLQLNQFVFNIGFFLLFLGTAILLVLINRKKNFTEAGGAAKS